MRTVLDKGAGEAARRAFYYGLSAGGRALLKGSERFLPDYSVSLSREEMQILARNRELHNVHAGKRGFVLGTGPSIACQDLSLLQGEITFAMNAFFKHPYVNARWQPTYYCLTDPLYFDGSPQSNQFLTRLADRITAAKLFLPIQYRQLANVIGLDSETRPCFVAFKDRKWYGPLNSIDLTVRCPSVLTVAELCILIAIYMGCNPIYLLGMEHDWLAHGSDVPHFYQGKELEGHPAVAKNPNNTLGYRRRMEILVELWKHYEEINELAESRGIKIYNATIGGWLDVFERVEFEEIVSPAPPTTPRLEPVSA